MQSEFLTARTGLQRSASYEAFVMALQLAHADLIGYVVPQKEPSRPELFEAKERANRERAFWATVEKCRAWIVPPLTEVADAVPRARAVLQAAAARELEDDGPEPVAETDAESGD